MVAGQQIVAVIIPSSSIYTMEEMVLSKQDQVKLVPLVT
jgi:hypothetical protein